MRILRPALALALLAGCGRGDEVDDDAPAADVMSANPTTRSEVRDGNENWILQSDDEGVSLVYSTLGKTALRLNCSAGGKELLVNIPAFHSIGSEERLSFGSGGEVAALVADTRGDKERGGVSGTGPVPENLSALIKGPIAVNYGYQYSGPFVAPAPELSRALVAACRKGTSLLPRQPRRGEQISPCLIQDGGRLRNPPIRAMGTEPFWGAQIEGRCVTYSHPENQEGTRIWTRFKPGPSGGGTWVGALGNRSFELTVRPQPGCSDGMSDRRYPFAVDLSVQGERRNGCAHLR